MTRPERPTGKSDWARLRVLSDDERLAGALADPDAPARALLTAIHNDPETMHRLVGGEPA